MTEIEHIRMGGFKRLERPICLEQICNRLVMMKPKRLRVEEAEGDLGMTLGILNGRTEQNPAIAGSLAYLGDLQSLERGIGATRTMGPLHDRP